MITRRHLVRGLVLGLGASALLPSSVLAEQHSPGHFQRSFSDRRGAGPGSSSEAFAEPPEAVIGSSGAVVVIQAPTDGTDVTRNIQEQIDSAPDGTADTPTVILFPIGSTGGRYHTEGELANNPYGQRGIIRIENRHHIVLTGPSSADPAVLFSEAPATDARGTINEGTYSRRRHLWIENSSDVAIRNIRIEGSNRYPDSAYKDPSTKPAFWTRGLPPNGGREGFGAYHAPWEFEHGIAIHGSSYVLVEDCSVHAVWGDGVYIGNQRPSTDVTIRRVTVSWNGRQGLAASHGARILFEDCRVENSRRAGIDLEPATAAWSVDEVTVLKCYLHSMHPPLAAHGRGRVDNVIVEQNRLAGPAVPWVSVVASDGTVRRNWSILGNTHMNRLGSPVAALRFAAMEGVQIRDNFTEIVDTQSQLAVALTNVKDWVISANDFPLADVKLNGLPHSQALLSTGQGVVRNTPSLLQG